MFMGFRKDKTKYHYFHHDYDDDIKDSLKLKEEIEVLIRRGAT